MEFEDQLNQEKTNRGTIDNKDFYDERPNNTIFVETSKE